MSHITETALQYIIDLAGGLEVQFAERGYDKPCILTPMPGEAVALDYCDNGECGVGMAWTRLVSIRPSDNVFQQQQQPCPQMYAIEVEVGMMRGAPTWDNGAPSAEAQMAATIQQMADAGLMLTVLETVETPAGDVASSMAYAPVGPEGGCLGGTWTATLEVY